MHVSKRITLVEKEDLVLDLEYNKDYAILHMPHMKLNRGSYTTLLSTVPGIFRFVNDIGGYHALHAAVQPDNKIVVKLLDRLGFRKLGTSPDNLDVYEYRGEG